MGMFDFLFKTNKTEEKSPGITKEDIIYLLRAGKKIEAIKHIREITNAGLKDAKEFADYLQEVTYSWELVSRKYPFMAEQLLQIAGEGEGVYSNYSIPGFQNLSDENLARIENMLRGNQKIPAIKLVREITGMGLKEAKEMVEYFQEVHYSREAIEQKYAFTAGITSDFITSTEARSLPLAWARLTSTERECFSPEETAEVENMIRNNQMIQAIKIVREKTGLGLRESKDFVEALRENLY